MAYIVFTANNEEICRRDLRDAAAGLLIGRANECDVAIRDILISRRHCRIEPAGDGWRIVDMGSRNGTRVGWTKVNRHALCDGDMARIGRTMIEFHAGPFLPPAETPNPDKIVRPADPAEALHGTVTGFVLGDEEPLDAEQLADAPTHAEDGGQSDENSLELIHAAARQSEWGTGRTAADEVHWQPGPQPTGRLRRPVPSPNPYTAAVDGPCKPNASATAPRRSGPGAMADLSLQVDPNTTRPPRTRWRPAFVFALTLILVPVATAALATTGFLLARVLMG